MKRIGIITILDYNNYGNRLQNLAMQEFLSGFGYRTETIRVYSGEKMAFKSRLRQIGPLRRVNWACRRLLALDSREEQLSKRRQEAVLNFNRRYVRISKEQILGTKVPDTLCQSYDWFVVGSDQVWNPHFMGIAAPLPYVVYLAFVPGNRRLAIAPSFGVAQLSPEEGEMAARYLKEFRFLSVREENGKALIKKLTSLDCPVIPDPTLLVEPAFWEDLARKDCGTDGDYVLAYFLGTVSPARRAFIQDYAGQTGKRVIWLNDLEHPETYAWGPEQFLAAIRGCGALFTDSFHGCVFSLVFRRQFFALRREGRTEDMSGRIATLLNMVGLEDRAVADGDPLPSVITSEQFEQVHQALAYRRAESTALLRDVLGEQA